jgi:hypothetical protein
VSVIAQMRSIGADAPPHLSWRQRRLRALGFAARVGGYAFLPIFLTATMLVIAARQDILALDFHHAFRPAADAVAHLDSPYVSPNDPELTRGTAFVYPPVSAFLLTPFTLVPAFVADVLMTLLLAALVPAILWLAGVRDWRCYGIAYLWAPVFSSLQTANLTLPLALGAVLVWRFRDQPRRCGLAAVPTFAAKIFLWPLALWLWVSGRRRAAVVGVVGAAALILVSWTAISFAGLAEYPAMLRRLTSLEEGESYSVFAIATELGSPELVARALGALLMLGLLAGTVVATRSGRTREGFCLAVAAALAASPIIWLHYFALLLVPVAISRPRLSLAWFLPIALWACAGTGNGDLWQTLLLVGIVAAVVADCVRRRKGASHVPGTSVPSAPRNPTRIADQPVL